MTLPSLNLYPNRTTVSGLSSGGYMAVQYHVAHSSAVMGAGVISAGPYYCAKDSLQTALGACMSTPLLINLDDSIDEANSCHRRGLCDDPALLEGQHAWLFHGTMDFTVVNGVARQLDNFYKHFGVQVDFTQNMVAGHTWPTESFGHPCARSQKPWIGDCDYNAAQEMLETIYGTLEEPSGYNTSSLIEFDQRPFIDASPSSVSLNDEGWVYIPESCAAGEECSLHIAFSGCQQYIGNIGTDFVEKVQLNEMAEANHMVILYPQQTSSANSPYNPNGCWDWWGYNDSNYANQEGPQIKMVERMRRRLMGDE